MQITGDRFRPDPIHRAVEHPHLRSETDSVRSFHVVERLYPETIACDEQFPPLRIVNRKREHPLEMCEEVATPAAVGSQNGFGIARSAPFHIRTELLADRAMIVDFAIADDDVAS